MSRTKPVTRDSEVMALTMPVDFRRALLMGGAVSRRAIGKARMIAGLAEAVSDSAGRGLTERWELSLLSPFFEPEYCYVYPVVW
jgi:hypothetical protein